MRFKTITKLNRQKRKYCHIEKQWQDHSDQWFEKFKVEETDCDEEKEIPPLASVEKDVGLS